jgi:chaperonin GroEL
MKLKTLKGDNNEEAAGIEIVQKALRAPITRILDNAALESALIVARLQENNKAHNVYDARTQQVVDGFAAGIVDPTKVVRSALQTSVSVAALLITTEATIHDKPSNDSAPSAPSMGGMGGGMPGMGGM